MNSTLTTSQRLAAVLRDGVGASYSIENLATALADLQIAPAPKNRRNAHLGSGYADLASVIESSREPLRAVGLSVVALTRVSDGRAGVVTLLCHRSGEWIGSSLLLPVGASRGANQAQQIGTAISYARRYALQALLNQASDDPDAEGLPGRPVRGSHEPVKAPHGSGGVQAPPEPSPAPRKVDTRSPRWKAFQASLTDRGLTYEEVAAWCEANNRSRPSAMTSEILDRLARHLATDRGRDEVLEHADRVVAGRVLGDS
jgi:hypothetical protein